MTAPDLPNSLFKLGFIFAKYHIENVIGETLLAIKSAKGRVQCMAIDVYRLFN